MRDGQHFGSRSAPQALLIVRSSSANKDLDVKVLQLDLELLESLDDALERGCHVGEVGDAAADDQDLATRIVLPRHEREQGLGIVIGLLLARCSAVLAVVGQFFGTAQGAHCVRVDDASAAASHHRPDTALGIQYGQLKGHDG